MAEGACLAGSLPVVLEPNCRPGGPNREGVSTPFFRTLALSVHHPSNEADERIGKIEMVANTGTYIDSPFHRYQNGKDLSELPIESVADLECLVVRIDLRSGMEIDSVPLSAKEVGGRVARDVALMAPYRGALRSEQGRRHHTDPVPPPIRRRTGRDHDGIQEVAAHTLLYPS